MGPVQFIVELNGVRYLCEYRNAIKGESYLVPGSDDPDCGCYWSPLQFDTEYPAVIKIKKEISF